jgi:hypothetical protein
VDSEVAKLIAAFKGELEACHRALDEAGVPRVLVNTLTLRDRIMVLVAIDKDMQAALDARDREAFVAEKAKGTRSRKGAE